MARYVSVLAFVLALTMPLMTATPTYATDGGGYALPADTIDTRGGDGGGYSLPSAPNGDSLLTDGGGYTVPTNPTSNGGDGGGYSVPTMPADTVNGGDGGGYSAPTTDDPPRILYGELWA